MRKFLPLSLACMLQILISSNFIASSAHAVPEISSDLQNTETTSHGINASKVFVDSVRNLLEEEFGFKLTYQAVISGADARIDGSEGRSAIQASINDEEWVHIDDESIFEKVERLFVNIDQYAHQLLIAEETEREVDVELYLAYLEIRHFTLSLYSRVSESAKFAPLENQKKYNSYIKAMESLMNCILKFYELSSVFSYNSLKVIESIDEDSKKIAGETRDQFERLKTLVKRQSDLFEELLANSFKLSDFNNFADFVEPKDGYTSFEVFKSKMGMYLQLTRKKSNKQKVFNIEYDPDGHLLIGLVSGDEWGFDSSLFEDVSYQEKTGCFAQPYINKKASEILDLIQEDDELVDSIRKIARNRGLKVRIVGAHAEGAIAEILAFALKKIKGKFNISSDSVIQSITFNTRNCFKNIEGSFNWKEKELKDNSLRFMYENNYKKCPYKGCESDDRSHLLIPKINNEDGVVTWLYDMRQWRSDRKYIQASIDNSRHLRHVFILQRMQNINLIEQEVVAAILSAKAASVSQTQGFIENQLMILDQLRDRLTQLYLAENAILPADRHRIIGDINFYLGQLLSKSDIRNSSVLGASSIQVYMARVSEFEYAQGVSQWSRDELDIARIAESAAESASFAEFIEAKGIVRRNYTKILKILKSIRLKNTDANEKEKKLVAKFFEKMRAYIYDKNETISRIEDKKMKEDIANIQLAIALEIAVPKATSKGNTGALFVYDLEGRKIGVFKGVSKDSSIKGVLGQRASLSSDDYSDMIHEVSVYEISKKWIEKLNYDVSYDINPVPQSRLVKLQLRADQADLEINIDWGVLMRFVNGQELDKYNPENWDAAQLISFQLIAVIDIVLGNVDRHMGNLLVPGPHEKGVFAWAIDNANILPKKGLIKTANNNFANWSHLSIAQQEFQPEIIQLIEQISSDEIKRIVSETAAQLDSGIHQYEIDPWMDYYLDLRLRALQKFIRSDDSRFKRPNVWKKYKNRKTLANQIGEKVPREFCDEGDHQLEPENDDIEGIEDAETEGLQ